MFCIKTFWLTCSSYSTTQLSSLVPWPSLPPDFDCLQCKSWILDWIIDCFFHIHLFLPSLALSSPPPYLPSPWTEFGTYNNQVSLPRAAEALYGLYPSP